MGKRRRLTLEWPPPRAEPAGVRRAPQHLARTPHVEAIYQVRDVQVSFSASCWFTFIFSKLWDWCVLIAKPSGSIDSDREAGDRICVSSPRGPPIRPMSVPVHAHVHSHTPEAVLCCSSFSSLNGIFHLSIELCFIFQQVQQPHCTYVPKLIYSASHRWAIGWRKRKAERKSERELETMVTGRS